MSDDKILIFDSVGKPIFKIDKRGKGPGEYSYLIDFNVYDNDIELFDHRQQKMLIYDQTGSFKGEWKCNLSAYSFGRIDTGLYAFYVGVNGSEGEKNYKLKYYSKAEEKVVQEYFPVPENEYSFMYILESNFSSATNPLLFYYMYNDTLYNLTPNGVHPFYAVDFGKYRLPQQLLTREYRDIREFFLSLNGLPYAHGILGVRQTSRSLIFQFSYKKRNNRHVYYYHKTQHALVASAYIDDMTMNGFFTRADYHNLPVAVSENKTYSIMDSWKFRARIDSLHTTLSPSEWKSFEEAHPETIEVYRQISPMDNPIIMIGSLKASESDSTFSQKGRNNTF